LIYRRNAFISTRGTYGFIKNKQLKMTYCQHDSYLEVLGNKIVEFLNNTSIEELNKIFDSIVLIDKDNLPTVEELVKCDKILKDLNIKTENGIKNWNDIFISAEGHLEVYQKDFKYMTDDIDFMTDPISCEYSYIINLDRNLLVIRTKNGIALFDLDNIPEDWIYDSKLQMGIFEKNI
jgi:hypothetical protein